MRRLGASFLVGIGDMDMVWLILGVYLLIGLVVVIVFELITGRIRQKLVGATYDTQQNLQQSGLFVGMSAGKIVILLSIWAFWPILIVGAVTSIRGRDNGK